MTTIRRTAATDAIASPETRQDAELTMTYDIDKGIREFEYRRSGFGSAAKTRAHKLRIKARRGYRSRR